MRKIFVILVLSVAFISCEDFFEEDLSKDAVSVIAPIDGVTVDVGNIKFLWDEVKGATSYRIVIVSPSFAEAGTVVGDEILVNDTLTRHRSYTCELAPGQYQWSLAAMNSVYSTPSKIFSLQVQSVDDGEGDDGDTEPDPSPNPEDNGLTE